MPSMVLVRGKGQFGRQEIRRTPTRAPVRALSPVAHYGAHSSSTMSGAQTRRTDNILWHEEDG